MAITATQTTVLNIDLDGDGQFDPLDTVTTTVVISNSAGPDALNVALNETLDGMTLVAGSINVSALAFDDAYNAVGNVGFVVGAADGVLNAGTAIHTTFGADAEFLGATVGTNGATQTVIQNPGVAIGTTGGGSATVAADGSFTYTPALDFNGTDTFTYTLVDQGGLTSTGTVSIAVGPSVWFIDNTAAAGGNGTQASPFNSIAAFNTANDGAAGHPGNGDVIYLRQGLGTYSESDGVNLRDGQRLIGQGQNLTVTPTGGGPAITIETGSAGQTPTISVTGASQHGIDLGVGNTIKGLNVATTLGSEVGIDDNTHNVGTLTISDVDISGTGKAVDIDQGGTLAVTIDSLGSTGSTTEGVDLQGIGGTFTATTGAISGATGTAFNLVGGTAGVTYGGNITQGNNAALVNVSGGHATGTVAFNTGTLSATNGTGLQFDNADGAYQFNGTNTLNGGDAGIDILNGSGGTFSFSANSSITNPSGTAFNLSASNANVTYSGSISDNTGKAVVIDNHDAGTVTFQTGSITSTGSGLTVSNSNGGAVNFNGQTTLTTGANTAVDLGTSNASGTVNFAPTGNGLDISTTSGTGFLATGGGTVSVTGTGNTISSGTGTALNIANTTIGASDVTFQSISAGTGAGSAGDGIILDTTGSSGGLHVTGNGTNVGVTGGGVIQHKTGADGSTSTGVGIYLNNTGDVQLNGLQLNDFDNFGVRGLQVSGFQLTNSVISGHSGNNDLFDEAAVAFGTTGGTTLASTGIVGNGTFTNVDVRGEFENNLQFFQTNGTSNLSFTNLSSHDTKTDSPSFGADGFLLETQNTANGTVLIQGSSFSNNFTQGVQANALDTSTLNMTVKSSTFANNNEGVVLANSGSGHLIATVGGNTAGDGNTVTGGIGVGIFVGNAGTLTTSATLVGAIRLNTVTQADGHNNDAIRSLISGPTTGSPSTVLDISGNTATTPANTAGGTGFRGIFVDTPDTGTSPTFDVTVNNNVVSTAGLGANGIALQARRGNGDFHVQGNSSTATQADAIFLRQVNADGAGNPSTFDLERGVSASSDPTQIIKDNNPAVTGAATHTITVLGTVNAVANGAVTTAPLLASNEMEATTPRDFPEWHAAGIGDFNGDGLADALVLRDDGLLRSDMLDGAGNTTNWYILGQVQAGWHIAGVGDVNNDGTSDILLRNDNGTYQAELIQNNAVTATVDLALVDGQWRVIPAPGPNVPTSDSPPVDPPVQPAPGTVEAHLTQVELDSIVAAAVARWEATGLTAAQDAYLRTVTFSVADMSGLFLGSATPGHIAIDSDAAGYGWFIDATPGDDAEFANTLAATRLQTDASQLPAGHIDLLTTVAHELGHQLGLDDSYALADRDSLMYGYLVTGERRLPGDHQGDGAVAGSIDHEEFAIGPVSIGTLPGGKQVTVQWRATIDAQTNQLIDNPVNTGSVTTSNLGIATTNTVTTTLDSLSLGNLIFNDLNNNGLFDSGTESGINGVTLTLFADNGTTPGSFDLSDTQIATTTTAGGGLYAFTGVTGLAPGDYILRIDQGNFTGGGALANLRASGLGSPDPDNNVDNDDNGQALAGQGHVTFAITLSYNDELTAGQGNDSNQTLDIGVLSSAPVAVDDTASVLEYATVTGNVITGAPGADIDPDTAPAGLTITAIAGGTVGVAFAGAKGTLTIQTDGGYSYVANLAQPMFVGSTVQDTFTYTVSDGVDTDTATLTVTITGSATGDGNANTLYGSVVGDTLSGLGGDDRLYGFGGNDTTIGGPGDDFHFVDDAGDVVTDGIGQGTGDRVFASTSYTLTAGAEIEKFSTNDHAGTSPINLTGNELDNVIYGNAGDNGLNGVGGNDTLYGLAGIDTLDGGSGNDLLIGGDGADILLGGANDDQLYGQAGNDQMTGGTGDDWYFVDDAGDVVTELAGEGTLDRVFASVSYVLTAGAEIEKFSTSFHAGTGAIDLTGNELANEIYGNAGSNVIDGKAGSDTLYGFGGSDFFLFDTALNAATNVDHIIDFNPANDIIRLDDAIFAALTPGALPAAAFGLGNTAGADPADRILYDGSTGAIYYDADGVAGGEVRFATVSVGLVLTAADFFVV